MYNTYMYDNLVLKVGNIIRKSTSKSVRKIFLNIIFLYLHLHTCTTLSSEHQRATGYELLQVMQYFWVV